MSNSGHSPLFGWWVLTRRAIEALTTPEADTVACDRTVARLARASWLGSTVDRGSAAIGLAWRHSSSNRVASWLLNHLTPAPPAATIRSAGWVTAVAGATALVLDVIKPTPVGPLSWVVPAGLVVAGVLLMTAAGPLARASDGRRRRQNVS